MFASCKKYRSVFHVETWISFLQWITVENILKSGKFRIQTTSVPRNALYRVLGLNQAVCGAGFSVISDLQGIGD